MAEGGDVLEFDCSICLSAFKVPKLLPCFHTFCLQCLDEYVTRYGRDGQFKCPLCRVKTSIPLGGVKSFQSNIYIQMDCASEADVRLNCDVCGDGHNATTHCVDCEENFCERCSTSHMKMKMSRDHSLLELTGSSADDGKIKRRVRKTYFCPHHSREEIKMSCKDCDSLLCVVCKLTEHENHQTSDLRKEAEERRASVSIAINKANHQLNLLKSKVMMTKKRAADIEKHLNESISTVDKHVEALIANIKKDADSIKQELIKRNTEVKKYYLENGILMESEVKGNQAVINHVQNVVDQGDDIQVMEKQLLSRLKSLAKTEDCLVKRKEYLIFQPAETTNTASVHGRTVTVSNNINVKYCDVIQCSPNTMLANAISVNTKCLYATFTDYNKCLFHQKWNKKSIFRDLVKTTGTCGGLTCVGTDLYFTCTEDKAVYKMKTEEFTKIKLMSFEDFPHGIASWRRKDNVANQLFICTMKNSTVMDLGDCEGSVYTVSIGDKKQTIWREKEKPCATCIAVNETDDTICLGYPAAGKVCLLTSDGIVLSEFCGTGCPGDADKFCPVSVCFDSQCCIIIADMKNKSVIRIDELGEFRQCLLRTKHSPFSIATGENTLYIGAEKTNIASYLLEFKQ